uniref:Ig-like domain-containing protein n=1 Tax=Callorhinchus milii TaxID=7868 RepID=A0A4W3GXM1_CALMI
MSSLISLSLLLAVFSRVQADVVLTQPPTLTGEPGQALRLTCKTSGFDLSTSWMTWFRQVPGKGREGLRLEKGDVTVHIHHFVTKCWR